jgi:hypothetical protein
MSETTEILTSLLEQQFSQAKQSEDQRANILGVIYTIIILSR